MLGWGGCQNRSAKAFAPSYSNGGMHLPGENKRRALFYRASENKKKPEHSAAPFTKRVLGEAMSASELHPKVLLLLSVATCCPKSLPLHLMAAVTTATGCWQERVCGCMPAGRVGWQQSSGKYRLYSSNRAVGQRCSGLSWEGWERHLAPEDYSNLGKNQARSIPWLSTLV